MDTQQPGAGTPQPRTQGGGGGGGDFTAILTVLLSFIAILVMVLIAIESQKVVEKEAETKKKMAMSEAEKNANVSKILMEQKLMEKDSSRRQEEIENQMYMAREKSLADADFYRVMREAEANKLKLTPQYLELKFIQAIANNSKIFFGDKVEDPKLRASSCQANCGKCKMMGQIVLRT
ncbi:hypothetical protein L1049_006906 [Liquidambar formosana]|uniref:Uncharacterized protein n=1 Tax=Liquidambar formosana TaxID=63359 RepID=A0AAP0RGK9_LIQFO